jgi:hypothetical protein
MESATKIAAFFISHAAIFVDCVNLLKESVSDKTGSANSSENTKSKDSICFSNPLAVAAESSLLLHEIDSRTSITVSKLDLIDARELARIVKRVGHKGRKPTRS